MTEMVGFSDVLSSETSTQKAINENGLSRPLSVVRDICRPQMAEMY